MIVYIMINCIMMIYVMIDNIIL